ncbi:MAG: PKD domain-containing protein, partial [Kiritimatiellae bacterium]|nr:PKD domain-containing protein [Kiritimatiellia bacterium]
FCAVLALTSSLACSLLFLGCEIDSAETSSREVGLIIAGFYQNTEAGLNNGRLVANNSGNPITTMDLRQSGDQLEGVDNNGNIFKGTIGNVQGSLASITLSGLTTAGNEGTISGQVDVEGAGTTNVVGATTSATMSGTWVEPTLYSTVYGKATVPVTPVEPEEGTNELTVAISPHTLIIGVAETVNFSATAQGGTPPYEYTFTDGNNLGSITAQSDNDATYVASGAGDNTVTVTVTDANGDTDSDTADITQQ